MKLECLKIAFTTKNELTRVLCMFVLDCMKENMRITKLIDSSKPTLLYRLNYTFKIANGNGR